MARIIVLTGGKGGVGKTSVVAGLGTALVRRGKRVCVMDTDVGLNNLDVTLGTEGRVVYDIADVASNRCRPRQALIEVSDCQGLFVLPSVKADSSCVVTAQAVREIALSLARSFDYVLIDCPAGIEHGFRRAVAAADEGIVVTTPQLTAVRDADKVLRLLKGYGYAGLWLVVNRVRGDLVLRGDALAPEQVAELVGCEICGVVPEDDEVGVSAGDGRIVKRTSEAAKAFDMIAARLEGESDAVYDARRRYKGALGSVRRKLRRLV